MSLPVELQALKRFHGHLGPYVVVGYRMGLVARGRFTEKIFAEVWSGSKRPLSCLADGIQFSSCCTLGKGNINVLERGEAKARFSDGTGCMEMVLREAAREDIEKRTTRESEESISLEIFEAPFDRIISVREGRSTPSGK